MRKVLIIAAVVALATVAAQAQVVGEWVLNTSPDPTNPPPAGHSAWDLALTSASGEITSLDLLIQQDNMMQYIGMGDVRIYFSTDNTFDSHFTFDVGPILDVETEETATSMGSAFTGFTGFSVGRGAYIVIPDGVTPTLDNLYNTNDSLHVGYAVVGGEKFPIIPEPATLALLGLGGLSVLLRRRRA